MNEALGVWMGGRYAGELIRTENQVSFSYDPEYRSARGVPDLSVSMPKTRSQHPPEMVEPWIDNLLPDNDTLRERWAARFGERRANPFNLLKHMGVDCAGAVQVLPAGTEPAAVGELLPVGEGDISAAIRVLRGDDSAWTFGEYGGRYSLGGAQGKFALAHTELGWALPTGNQPSTHIVKVGLHQYPEGAAAEFVTMRAAEILGMSVTRTRLVRFGDETALVSQRFDRRGTESGTVRIHQEDLCQAMGVSRHRKYESDGGPAIADIGEFIRTVIDPRDRRAARESIAQAVVFNWLVAGTDAHAKNYAVAHLGSRVLLAPLYDLTSAVLLEPPKEIAHRAKLAMKIGGEYGVGKIGPRHLERAAGDLGVSAEWMLQTAGRYANTLESAVRRAAGEAELEPELVDRFISSTEARLDYIDRALSTASSPPHRAPPSASPPTSRRRGPSL